MDLSIRVSGGSGLFYFTVLCSYTNFRTSYKRIGGINYTIYPGEWLCRIEELTKWFRTRFHWQVMAILDKLQKQNLIIYTTNAVEGFHRMMRKFTKNKVIYPADDSLKKSVYLSVKEITKKWSQPVMNLLKCRARSAGQQSCQNFLSSSFSQPGTDCRSIHDFLWCQTVGQVCFLTVYSVDSRKSSLSERASYIWKRALFVISFSPQNRFNRSSRSSERT